MVTTDIKNYSDEKITVLISKYQNGEVPYTINDLKKLLSEVNNRKLDSQYINALTSLMYGEIMADKSEPVKDEVTKEAPIKRRVTKKAKLIKKEQADNPPIEKTEPEKLEEPVFDDSFVDEYEKFPVLSFLAGLFKVLAWFFLVVMVLASAVVSYIYFSDEILFMACAVFGGIMIGTIFLIFFYAQSEKIQLKLEIERHLRK